MRGRRGESKNLLILASPVATISCAVGAAIAASLLRQKKSSIEPRRSDARRPEIQESADCPNIRTEGFIKAVQQDGEQATRKVAVSPPSAVLGMTGLIVANSSLILAVFVYLGWANEDAYYGYFNLHPIDLGASVLEYLLSSIDMFNPVFFIFVAGFAAIFWVTDGSARLTRAYSSAIRVAAGPHMPKLIRHQVKHLERPQSLQIIVGFIATGAALVVVTYRFSVSIYMLLALLASGPVLMTRARDSKGSRPPHILAVLIAGISLIWAGSIYAHNVGLSAAQGFASNLQKQTAAAVYTTAPLALAGPGVEVEKFSVSGLLYNYRYTGLRVLTVRAGTYYLLAAEWTPQLNITYIIEDSDDTRIELYSGLIPNPYPGGSPSGYQGPENPNK